jgi:polar amino acid transport system substrate-binding protein
MRQRSPEHLAGRGLLVALLAVGLGVAGCAEPTDSAGGGAAPHSAAPAGSTTAATEDSAINAQIPAAYRNRGSLTACVGSSPPWSSSPTPGQYEGAMIDLYQQLSTVLGVTIKPTVVAQNETIAGVQANRCDLAGPFGDFTERHGTVNFADFAISNVTVLVRSADPAQPKSGKDLCGKTGGIEAGGNSQLVINEINQVDCAGSPVRSQNYTTLQQANLALSSSRISFVLAPVASNGYAAVQSHGQWKSILLPDILKLGSAGAIYGIMTNKQGGLAAAVLAGVQELQKDGIYQAVFAKWGLGDAEIPLARMQTNGSTQSQSS